MAKSPKISPKLAELQGKGALAKMHFGCGERRGGIHREREGEREKTKRGQLIHGYVILFIE